MKSTFTRLKKNVVTLLQTFISGWKSADDSIINRTDFEKIHTHTDKNIMDFSLMPAVNVPVFKMTNIFYLINYKTLNVLTIRCVKGAKWSSSNEVEHLIQFINALLQEGFFLFFFFFLVKSI